jgi:predicted GH43/DUF377 family glycosyl hydrolase
MGSGRNLFFRVLAGILAFAPGCGDGGTGTLPPRLEWRKHAANPVLSRGPAGSWDAFEVATPRVLVLGLNSYAMWYTGRDGRRSQIGIATSTDGVTWTKYAGNPILGPGTTGTWEGLDVEDPCVLYDGGVYMMYYTGWGPASNGIGLAFSDDGFNWVRSPANPVLTPSPAGTSWDDKDVYTPWVRVEGRDYEMWYGATDTIYRAIGHATSLDGITWTKLLRPVLDPQPLEAVTYAPCVLKTSSQYQMWYGAAHENVVGGVTPGVIDHALSLDGVEWTSNQTVLSPGGIRAWDGGALRSACVVNDAGRLEMWYEARGISASDSTQGSSSIGLATYE